MCNVFVQVLVGNDEEGRRTDGETKGMNVKGNERYVTKTGKNDGWGELYVQQYENRSTKYRIYFNNWLKFKQNRLYKYRQPFCFSDPGENHYPGVFRGHESMIKVFFSAIFQYGRTAR